MDKMTIVNGAKINIVLFGVVAATALILNYLVPDVGFFCGCIVGASVFAIYFQTANLRTFFLMAQLVEAVQAISDRKTTKI